VAHALFSITLPAPTPSRSGSYPIAADELFGDDIHLDLIRSLADDHQRRIAVVAFDIVFGGVSVTAVDADRVKSHLGGHLRSVELRHSGLHIHPRSGIIGTGRVEDELAGRFELRRHHRELVAHRLVLPDRLAHRFAFLRVLHRIIERRLRDAEGPGGDLDAADLEALHHLLEPDALGLAEQLRLRLAKVPEVEFAGLDALVAELREVLGDGEALALLDEDDRDPLVPRLSAGVGLAQQGDEVGATGVRDPRLRPV